MQFLPELLPTFPGVADLNRTKGSNPFCSANKSDLCLVSQRVNISRMINLRIEFEKENTSSLDLVVIMMLEADILLCWYKQPGTALYT